MFKKKKVEKKNKKKPSSDLTFSIVWEKSAQITNWWYMLSPALFLENKKDIIMVVCWFFLFFL